MDKCLFMHVKKPTTFVLTETQTMTILYQITPPMKGSSLFIPPSMIRKIDLYDGRIVPTSYFLFTCH